MPRYKRSAAEAQLDAPAEPQMSPENAALLSDLRNMWEFASLMQYIFLFGHVVKIDEDFDIEDLEHECLQPTPSEKLAQIGLAMLKYVSSHRGLTPEIFDEYTRRQYLAKAPARNPFGDDEEPIKFNDLDIFTRIRVLQQLSTWTLGNAERIRNMMSAEEDDHTWRMEPLGWDKEDRAYFVLDDNRLYRRTDAPVPPPTPPKPKAKAKSKSKSKKAVKPRTRGTRSSKRVKVEATPEEDEEDEEMEDAEAGAADETAISNGGNDDMDGEPAYGFTNKTWECIAVTLEEYQDFLATIFRSKDPNEKQLRKSIEENVLPILEKRAEALRQKQLKKLRELENLQKMATAKRSGRLAEKQEKERQDREVREAEEKKQAEIRMAHEEQERQKRIEEGHESRRLTREQRLKEREVKRILHEEELERLEQEAERAASQDPNGESTEAAENRKRLSERQLKTQREQHKKELEQLAEDDGNWFFDCAVCGLHGENLDDGTHSLACERCNVWQHSACHGFDEKEIENPDFHFVCGTCKRNEKKAEEEKRRKEEEAKRPKIPSLKLGKSRASGSPEASKSESRPASAQGPKDSGLPPHVQRQLDGVSIPPPPPGIQQQVYAPHQNGYPYPHQQEQGPPALGHHYYHPNNGTPSQPPQQPWQGSPLPPPGRPGSSSYAGSPPAANGYAPPMQHHQQQHQYAHQHAVQGSGAHPGYQPQQQVQQPYGYGPRPTPPHFPMSSPSMQYPQAQQRPSQPSMQQQPYRQPAQQSYPPSSSQLMNGFQSPVKRPPPSSPAQAPAQTTPQPQQSPLIPSPKTSFPPPSNGYANNAGHSPTKSSPPQPSRQIQQPGGNPSLGQPKPHATPSNGHQSVQHAATPSQPHHSPYPAPPHTFRTPTSSFNEPPAPASANANGISADGMSGPWPESSKVIPQKHDQPPAPLPPPQQIPGSVQGNVMGGAQPNLAPSPMQRAEAEKGSVPVKKEMEGQPASQTSDAPTG